MTTKVIALVVVLSLCLLIKYLRSELFLKLCFRYADWRRIPAEENWKRVRQERIEWETRHWYAPKWHPERQELLRRELGTFMLFVERGPQFSRALLECREKDIETLAAQIIDDNEIFQNQDEE